MACWRSGKALEWVCRGLTGTPQEKPGRKAAAGHAGAQEAAWAQVSQCTCSSGSPALRSPDRSLQHLPSIYWQQAARRTTMQVALPLATAHRPALQPRTGPASMHSSSIRSLTAAPAAAAAPRGRQRLAVAAAAPTYRRDFSEKPRLIQVWYCLVAAGRAFGGGHVTLSAAPAAQCASPPLPSKPSKRTALPPPSSSNLLPPPHLAMFQHKNEAKAFYAFLSQVYGEPGEVLQRWLRRLISRLCWVVCRRRRRQPDSPPRPRPQTTL